MQNFDNVVEPLDSLHPRPEWKLGPKGMSRDELKAYCRKYRGVLGLFTDNKGMDTIDRATNDFMIKRLEMAIDEGKVPHPYTPPQSLDNLKVQELEKKVQELMATVERLAKQPTQDVVNPLDFEEIKTLSSGKEPEKMGWGELRKYANSLGIENVHGMNREQILEAIKAK